MPDDELIQSLNAQLEIFLPDNILQNDLLERLSAHINQLIQNDFEKLVHILYKADVSETKLKQLLKTNPTEDAAAIIAKLILEREREKINSRKQYTPRDNSNEEKW